jgi:hypothetical protein
MNIYFKILNLSSGSITTFICFHPNDPALRRTAVPVQRGGSMNPARRVRCNATWRHGCRGARDAEAPATSLGRTKGQGCALSFPRSGFIRSARPRPQCHTQAGQAANHPFLSLPPIFLSHLFAVFFSSPRSVSSPLPTEVPPPSFASFFPCRRRRQGSVFLAPAGCKCFRPSSVPQIRWCSFFWS